MFGLHGHDSALWNARHGRIGVAGGAIGPRDTTRAVDPTGRIDDTRAVRDAVADGVDVVSASGGTGISPSRQTLALDALDQFAGKDDQR